MQYIALDGVLKAFDRAGVRYKKRIPLTPAALFEAHTAENFDAILTGENLPDQEDGLWFYRNLYGAEDFCVELVPEQDGNYWISTSRERERAEQAAREVAIFALMPCLPGAIVIRHTGSAYIVGKMHGARYYIECGTALCKKVIVGTKTVSVPKDAELAAKLQEQIDMVETVDTEEPVYGWQCNDAELGQF
jgi:hypothetical protein